MILPSIHTDHLAEALTTALCDGNHNIIIPTTTGVTRRHCPGCRSCTPRIVIQSDGGKAMAEQRRRMAVTAVFDAAPSDEEW